LVDPAAQALRHNRLLAAMPPNTLALLEPDLRQVSLEQGAILLEPGELIENIYFPLTGLISLTVIGKDGSSIEASTVGREGAVGLHSGRADRIGSDQVPLTQELLAQMLGTRRTTVSLLAQRMQAKGLIRYRRGRIVILDRKALEACACDCYHIMHDEKLPHALGVNL